MSCSFSVTRAFAVPGLLLLLSLAAVLSPVIGAKPLPAAAVLEAFTGVCQSADCTIVWMRVCRVRWPDYWQAARWVSPGAHANTYSQPARRPGDSGR